jgi:hypothetical protein
MKVFVKTVFVFSAIAATTAFAAAPADAPAGSMGMCKDGTYSTAVEKKGACSGHKGVKDWYAEAPATKAAVSERAPAPPPPLTTSSPVSAKPATPAVAGRTSGAPTEPTGGAGAGKVWANTSTKVYHCQGAKYYGTTKHGEYMSEADAKTKGYHADHGKACA